MAILNYTTKIPVETTIAEIEKLLSGSGAQKILKEYDDEGNIKSIQFVLNVESGQLPFKLPMNVDVVLQTLKSQSGEYRRQPSGKHVRIVP